MPIFIVNKDIVWSLAFFITLWSPQFLYGFGGALSFIPAITAPPEPVASAYGGSVALSGHSLTSADWLRLPLLPPGILSDPLFSAGQEGAPFLSRTKARSPELPDSAILVDPLILEPDITDRLNLAAHSRIPPGQLLMISEPGGQPFELWLYPDQRGQLAFFPHRLAEGEWSVGSTTILIQLLGQPLLGLTSQAEQIELRKIQTLDDPTARLLESAASQFGITLFFQDRYLRWKVLLKTLEGEMYEMSLPDYEEWLQQYRLTLALYFESLISAMFEDNPDFTRGWNTPGAMIPGKKIRRAPGQTEEKKEKKPETPASVKSIKTAQNLPSRQHSKGTSSEKTNKASGWSEFQPGSGESKSSDYETAKNEIFGLAKNSDKKREVAEMIGKFPRLVNEVDQAGNTPLLVAADYGGYEICKALLDRKSDPNHQNSAGNTALILAAPKGFSIICGLLLEHNANPHLLNDKSESALALAVHQRHKNVINTLLRFGAKNIGWYSGLRPWELGCRELASGGDIGHLKDYIVIVKLLQDLHAHPGYWNEAAQLTDPDELRDRIQQLSPDIPAGFIGVHQIIEAPDLNDATRIELLTAWLDSDCGGLLKDIHHSQTGDTPLMTATRQSNLAVVDFLISRKADPNRQNLKGMTPLMIACLQQNATIVERLLQVGAEVSVRNSDNYTANDLIRNAKSSSGALSLISKLLEKQERLNEVDSFIPLLEGYMQTRMQTRKEAQENKARKKAERIAIRKQAAVEPYPRSELLDGFFHTLSTLDLKASISEQKKRIENLEERSSKLKKSVEDNEIREIPSIEPQALAGATLESLRAKLNALIFEKKKMEQYAIECKQGAQRHSAEKFKRGEKLSRTRHHIEHQQRNDLLELGELESYLIHRHEKDEIKLLEVIKAREEKNKAGDGSRGRLQKLQKEWQEASRLQLVVDPAIGGRATQQLLAYWIEKPQALSEELFIQWQLASWTRDRKVPRVFKLHHAAGSGGSPDDPLLTTMLTELPKSGKGESAVMTSPLMGGQGRTATSEQVAHAGLIAQAQSRVIESLGYAFSQHPFQDQVVERFKARFKAQIEDKAKGADHPVAPWDQALMTAKHLGYSLQAILTQNRISLLDKKLDRPHDIERFYQKYREDYSSGSMLDWPPNSELLTISAPFWSPNLDYLVSPWLKHLLQAVAKTHVELEAGAMRADFFHETEETERLQAYILESVLGPNLENGVKLCLMKMVSEATHTPVVNKVLADLNQQQPLTGQETRNNVEQLQQCSTQPAALKRQLAVAALSSLLALDLKEAGQLHKGMEYASLDIFSFTHQKPEEIHIEIEPSFLGMHFFFRTLWSIFEKTGAHRKHTRLIAQQVLRDYKGKASMEKHTDLLAFLYIYDQYVKPEADLWQDLFGIDITPYLFRMEAGKFKGLFSYWWSELPDLNSFKNEKLPDLFKTSQNFSGMDAQKLTNIQIDDLLDMMSMQRSLWGSW